MAALSERDLRRILGDQYDGGVASSPAGERVQQRKKKKDTVDDRTFTAFAAVVMGCGLIVSAYATATGQAFWIQIGVAGALILAGLIWYGTARRLALQPDQDPELPDV